MATEKENGGLGFRNIQDFNSALLAKQLWCIITQPNLFMSRVMNAKYFSNGEIFQAMANNQSSWLWKSWLEVREILESGVRYQIGNGKSDRVWESPWLETNPSFRPLSRRQ